MTFRRTFIRFLTTASMFVLCVSVYAQEDAFVSTDILLSLSPAYPGPREEVRITARTFSFDISATSLSWYVNERLVKSGKGVADITVTTNALGTPTVITVMASPPTTTRYEKTLTIWPSDLDVVWHANTYTPPGYRGKALPVRGSTVTLVAMPSFATENGYYDPRTLLYEWRVDNILQKVNSGKGRSALSLPITRNKNAPPDVSVRVYNEDKTVTQEKHMPIPVREPELLFYELHPLEGPLYQHAIGDIYRVKSGGETQILAEPYYASGKPTSLNFQWKVDAINLSPDTKRPDVLAYHSEAGSAAEQTILLEIQNPFYILEQIRKSFRIHVE